jgi:short-subunit dehydrogenase
MTSLILKQMVERNRGVVINIGSSAANSTMAMWGVYSASKVRLCPSSM